MKAISFSILKWVVAAVMILGLGVAPLQASQYLGEVTWTYSGGGSHQGRHQQGWRVLL